MEKILTIQDIDVECADQVTTQIVTNTCLVLSNFTSGLPEHGIEATAKPLSMEL